MRGKLRTLRDQYEAGGVRAAARAIVRFGRQQVGAARRLPKARQVNQWKRRRTEGDLAYEHDPRVSFLIQWFNQCDNVPKMASRLPSKPEYETVVCEDGSIDGSLAAWDDHLSRRNDFIVRSRDLHEIRTYTRAIGLARGEFVCLLQDDDTLPPDTDWVDESLALFEAHPEMAVLCGQSGWGLQDLSPDYRFDPPTDHCHPVIDDMLRTGGGFVDERPDEVPTADPTVGRPFVFVPCISVGPVFIRTAVFEELGGFDFGFSNPGDPGMGFEVDFGLRCWEAGYRVGFTPMGLERADVGGTKTFEQQDRSEAKAAAWDKLRTDHRHRFDEISERVHAANTELTPDSTARPESSP